MNGLKRLIRRCRARLRRMSRNARIATLLLAAAAVVGGVWLAWSAGRTRYVAVLDEPLAPAQMLEAQRLLDSRGISHRTDSGLLMVPEGSISQARSILDYEGLLGRSDLKVDDLVGETNIWSPAAENDKRDHARRMALLSRLISNFPEVRSATVLYDPGRKRTLGSPPVKPTASVNVTLHTGAKMTPKLLAAIADQVSGCIAGMQRSDVRIIEGGQSYYASSEPVVADAALEQLLAAERHYTRRIETALAYIGDVIIAVDIDQAQASTTCRGASVAIPRSYIVAVAKAACSEPTEEQIAAVAAEQMSRIQQSVMRVIGADESNVKVDWYYDSLQPAGEVRPPAPATAANRSSGIVLCGVLFIAGLFAAVGAAARHKANRLHSSEIPSTEAAAGAMRPFSFLDDVANVQVASLLRSERPQAIAIVLAHLRPAKAAAVLAELSPQQQVDVTRRLADLERIDGEVLREVEHSLAERAGELIGAGGAAAFGGVGRVAEILQHAGHETESAVLRGLSSGGEGELADSIHRKLMAFEDIARLPASRLREALGLLESDELAIALRTAGDGLKKKVLSALGDSAARRVRQEMESIGPVRLSDVEAAQQRVTEMVRRVETGTYASDRHGSEVIA